MKNSSNIQDELYDKFNKTNNDYTDTELVNAFNGQVGNRGSGPAKMSYLRAIRTQLIKRKIDFSVVGDKEGLSYARKVFLKGNKMYLLKDKN